MKRIKIAGIGNVLLGDDGAGPYALHRLETEYDFAGGVELADLGTPGLDLIAHLSDVDFIILIDSVKNGAAPGTVSLYRKDEIVRAAPKSVRVDPHSPALSETLMIADFAGEGAGEVLLIGITGAEYEANRPITMAAREGSRRAMIEVFRELDRLGIAYGKKAKPTGAKPWWEPLAIELSGPAERPGAASRGLGK